MSAPERPDLSGLEALTRGRATVMRFVLAQPDDEGAEAVAGAASTDVEQTEAEPDVVDVLVAPGVPAAGYASCATIGMRAFPTNLTTEDGREVRTELLLAARADEASAAAEILATCAQAVAAGAFHLTPGTVLPGAVSQVLPGAGCEHVVLAPPFLWPEVTVVEDSGDPGETVLTRLQAVPITADEAELVAADGAEALFDRLERGQVDVTRFDRSGGGV